MSEWLRLIDAIKRNATEQYLTPTQHAAYQAICELLCFPQRVNLWGASGSGKTFVAWTVARTTGAIHLPLPNAIEHVGEGTEILLIDNAPVDEMPIRALWAKCNLLSVRSVVLITREPTVLPMRRIMLTEPSVTDWQVVSRTLMRFGHLPPSHVAECSDFWTFLRG